ncbi:MAG: patatin-like phospholipase family protein [Lachnospiraceae bacterium]|nr:patatin-like phospholipase family protein [Lachnospiraceae bacterium]
MIDREKTYGLVLEGGGARGAYQIGCWQALDQLGIKISGISGASVGSLNGALICMNDLEGAMNLWQNLTFSKVIDVDDDAMMKFLQKQMPLKEKLGLIFHQLNEKGFDVEPLKETIEQLVDEDKIRSSDRDLYIQVIDADKKKDLEVDVKTLAPGQIKDYLLGSAYFPLFKNERLGGKRFLDGGMANNVPINALIKRNYKDIIVLRIYGIGREKHVRIPDDVKLFTVAPTEDLGNILDFSSENTQYQIKLGYYDTLEALYGMNGRRFYYTLPTLTETEAYGKLFKLLSRHRDFLKDYFEIQDEALENLRQINERCWPYISFRLGLPEDWDYVSLYAVLLEIIAEHVKEMERFKFYEFNEFEAQALA